MKQRIKKKLLSKNPKTKEEFKLESTGKLSPLPNLNQSIQQIKRENAKNVEKF